MLNAIQIYNECSSYCQLIIFEGVESFIAGTDFPAGGTVKLTAVPLASLMESEIKRYG